MAASETEVANIALDLLKEQPVNNFTDDVAAARWFGRNFNATRDELLRSHPWNFAMKRAALAADSPGPNFGWAFSYTLPSTCLRLLMPTVDGSINGIPIGFEVEGRKVLTNQTAPLKIRFVQNGSAVPDWDPLFVQALAGLLALKLSNWLTGKAEMSKLASDYYQAALSAGRLVDATEDQTSSVWGERYVDVRSQ